MAKKILSPPEMEGGPAQPSLKKASRQRTSLHRLILDELEHRVNGQMDRADFEHAVNAIAEYLSVSPRHVEETVTPFYVSAACSGGQFAQSVAHYLPGVVWMLKRKTAAPPMSMTGDQEVDLGFHPVQVLDMRVNSAKDRVEYLCASVSGQLYGQKGYISSDLQGAKQATLRFKLGFRSQYLARSRYKRLTPRDVVGMYAWVRAVYAPAWKIKWNLVEIPISMRAAHAGSVFGGLNRKLMNTRQGKCPMLKQLPCCGCHVGRDECQRAVRPHTVTPKEPVPCT